MTGNVLIDLAISFTGIAILVGLARLIFPNAGDGVFSADTARARLTFDEPDFQVEAWLVDEGRDAALAVSRTGEIALIKKNGDGLVTRRVAPGALECRRDGAEMALAVPDHTFRGFIVRGSSDSEAQQWAVRIAGGDAI